MELCIKCKTAEVFIKGRGLCKRCYDSQYKNRTQERNGEHIIKSTNEVLFIRNFFTHNE